MFGGHESLNSDRIHPDHIMTTLCGAPTVSYHHYTSDNVIAHLIEGEQRNFAMVAKSKNQPRGDLAYMTTGYYYTVLAVHEITYNKEPVRLLKIRCPDGSTEWQGEWSDKSRNWSRPLKSILGWEDKEDGIFFMNEEDYFKVFESSYVCKIVDGNRLSKFPISGDKSFCLLKFGLRTEGITTFSFEKTFDYVEEKKEQNSEM